MTTINLKTNKFDKRNYKNSLFENLNYDFDSDYELKKLLYEIKQDIAPILKELEEWNKNNNRVLVEGTTRSGTDSDEVIKNFIARGKSTADHVRQIDSKFATKSLPPKGIFNKICNAIKRAFEKTKKLPGIKHVISGAQQLITKLENGLKGNLLGRGLLKFLSLVAKLNISTATYVIIILSIISPFVASFVYVGNVILGVKLIAVACRIIADGCQGRSFPYAVTKAGLIWFAGNEISAVISGEVTYLSKIYHSVSDYINGGGKIFGDIANGGIEMSPNSVSGPVPPGNAGFRASAYYDGSYLDNPPDSSSTRVDLGTPSTDGSTTSSSTRVDLGGNHTPELPDPLKHFSVSSPHAMTALEKAYDGEIPDLTEKGDFTKAFAYAREQYGSGHLFTFGNDVYPTNFNEKGENMFTGFSKSVIKLLKLGVK